MRIFFLILFIFVNSFSYAQTIPLQLLHLPPGFSIEIFAAPIINAREMTLGTKGTVFVGSLSAGNVYAVVPDAHSPHGHKVITIASGLNMPNGVAFRNGDLYVSSVDRILKYEKIEDNLNKPTPIVITDKLPDKSEHGWRFIRFGPDGKLYIGVGAPCNVCLSDNPQFATIMRIDPDGSHLEIFTQGVRNTVGFDWDPLTKKLWFTDNGRDWMGDSLPPDEINVAAKKDLNFGFPYCHGKNVSDPDFGKLHSCSEFTSPTLELPAHVAPLGLIFYTGKMFPDKYHNQIFVAEHGSWNRSTKIGYQVISAKIDSERADNPQPFISGWLQGQQPWGRPVAFLLMPDGSLLISDDYANVIYRVTYKK